MGSGALDNYGYRSVVVDFDRHESAEHAPGDGYSEALEKLDETLVERLGQLGARRFDKAGAPAAAAVPVEGELGDRQNRTSRFQKGAVHPPLPVGENAQVGALVGAEPGRVVVVFRVDSDEQHEAAVDGPHGFFGDGDPGAADPLNEDSHGCPVAENRDAEAPGSQGA